MPSITSNCKQCTGPFTYDQDPSGQHRRVCDGCLRANAAAYQAKRRQTFKQRAAFQRTSQPNVHACDARLTSGMLMTHQEVADKLFQDHGVKLSRERVRQLELTALDKIRRHPAMREVWEEWRGEVAMPV